MHSARLLLIALVLPLAACGQKGNLYEPDKGITVEPTTTAPDAPASPDRSDEGRKRIPRTPTPAESK